MIRSTMSHPRLVHLVVAVNGIMITRGRLQKRDGFLKTL
jgi:hypothetical protein